MSPTPFGATKKDLEILEHRLMFKLGSLIVITNSALAGILLKLLH